MTREERLEWLKQIEKDIYVCSIESTLADDMKSCAIHSAIEELEQEPCEDAISRHAVLETIDSRIEQIKKDANAINESYSHLSFAEGVHDGYCRLKCDLWILPSVTPKQKMGRWIPVSERLPEAGDHCLCCDEDGYRTIGYVSRWSQEWCFDDDDIDIDVIAWMPLPEPYTAEKDKE